jgi:hypothetical protein
VVRPANGGNDRHRYQEHGQAGALRPREVKLLRTADFDHSRSGSFPRRFWSEFAFSVHHSRSLHDAAIARGHPSARWRISRY